jgi:hypothetical protein
VKTFICHEQPWGGLTLRMGVEVRDPSTVAGDEFQMGCAVMMAREAVGDEPHAAIRYIGDCLFKWFLDRAFWIELGEDGRWYQLYEHGAKPKPAPRPTFWQRLRAVFA